MSRSAVFLKALSKVRSLLIAAAMLAPLLTLPVAQAHAGVFISVNFAPPALPVYVQPALPAPGYLWTPGYWGYGDAGYYWVPGVWVQPPTVGLLWTPGYWGYAGGVYGWRGGYWGSHIGFYGGVNYGFGFGGVGFVGGEWRGGVFAYNSAVANFGSVHVTNVYENRTIVTQNTIVNVNHTSFNGGAGGIEAHASAAEMQAANEQHVEPTSEQTQHQTAASQDRSQLASVNHGKPATPAASSANAYHQVAQQHAQSQPISAADRSAGKSYNPSTRAASPERAANNSEAARTDRPQAATTQPARNERAANTQPNKPASREQSQSKPNNQKHNNSKPAKPAKEPK
jgi:hypothetical protein